MKNCAIITVELLNQVDILFNEEGKENLDILILNQKVNTLGTDIYLMDYTNYQKIIENNLNIEDLIIKKREEESIRNDYFIFRKISNQYLNQFANKFQVYEKFNEKDILLMTTKDLPFIEEETLNTYKSAYSQKELSGSQFLMSIMIHLLIHIFYSLEEYANE